MMLTMSLHDAQKFYDNLRGRSDENLALSSAFSIDDVILWVDDSQLRAIEAERNTYKAIVLSKDGYYRV